MRSAAFAPNRKHEALMASATNVIQERASLVDVFVSIVSTD